MNTKYIGAILIALLFGSTVFLSGLASAKDASKRIPKRIQLLDEGSYFNETTSHGELYCVDGYEVFVVVVDWNATHDGISSHQIIGADGKPVRCKLK